MPTQTAASYEAAVCRLSRPDSRQGTSALNASGRAQGARDRACAGVPARNGEIPPAAERQKNCFVFLLSVL
jgi:hypothetical protein